MKEIYDESDWSDLEIISHYDKSKTLAEQAAWDFLKSIPTEDEASRFELITLLPGLIQGPPLYN